MDTYVKLEALGQAALEGLIAGTGIAIFFALGLRALAMRTADQTPGSGDGRPEGDDLPEGAAGAATAAAGNHGHPAGLVLAVLSFAIAAGIVVVGLYVMVTSK